MRALAATLLRVLPVLALLAAPAAPARADEPAPPAPPSPEPPAVVEEALPVAEITGDRVNLRVGPRAAGRPVGQLAAGDVVLVVEETPGWYGVRVPVGFPVAVSLDYVVPEGLGGLRVMARNLNLRASPPEPGRPLPGAFRDHPALGEVLVLIDIAEVPGVPAGADAAPGGESAAPEGAVPADSSPPPLGDRWAWVLAPEGIRAYVSAEYVRVIAEPQEASQRLTAARAKREADVAGLLEARRLLAAREAGMRVMAVTGEVQQELHRLRQAGGNDRAPVVELATRLEQALRADAQADPAVLRLAVALRDDLEREIQLRVARHDVEVARTLGRAAPEVPPLVPRADSFAATGILRYEPTPGWKEEGVWFLWVDGKPAYALRLTVGGDLPHTRFVDHADGQERHVEGALPGERLFGLPVLDVRRVRLP